MSDLIFDANLHQLTLVDGSGKVVKSWPAKNRVDSHVGFRGIPDNKYDIQPENQRSPTLHPGQFDEQKIPYDDPNGKFGVRGIIKIKNGSVTGHTELGVHSGRAYWHDTARQGPDHPTLGCIRTTDQAMLTITSLMKSDPLLHLTVRNSGKH